MNSRTLLRSIVLLTAAAVVLMTAVFLYQRTPQAKGHRAVETAIQRPSTSMPGSEASSTLTAAEWMAKIRNTAPFDRGVLMREILAVNDTTLREEIASALAAEWMAGDPDGFLAFLDVLQIEGGLSSDVMRRFSPALQRSFETVAGGRELGGKMRYVADVIIDHLMATNPDGSEAWARQVLVGADLDGALGRIAPALAEASPERAMAVFASMQTPHPRLAAAAEMGSTLARRDPAVALAWANANTVQSERALAMAGVSSALAEVDPSLAATSFKAFLDRIQGEYTARREEDRQRAGIKPADEFQTVELYQEYLENGGYSLPPPDSPEADYLLKSGETIGRQLADGDPVAALAWAESLAVSLAQAHAINGVLAGWSATAPQQALNYYQQHYAEDHGMARSIFEQWAQADPDAAVQALGQLPSSAHQSAAIAGLTSGWLEAGHSMGTLVDWVNQMPAGSDRDTASVAVIAHSTSTDPTTAWRLVQQISADTARHRAARVVLAEIATANPAEARALLGGFNAPTAELESLGRMLAVAEKKP